MWSGVPRGGGGGVRETCLSEHVVKRQLTDTKMTDIISFTSMGPRSATPPLGSLEGTGYILETDAT